MARSPLVGEVSGRTEGGISAPLNRHVLHRMIGPQRVPSGKLIV
ncbi:hypothetical protein BSY16_136 [Sinorhizobium sp. RAC02]|nr:hypothetical protein BSY16_136 [Sinorhizobium sp. RAC02]